MIYDSQLKTGLRFTPDLLCTWDLALNENDYLLDDKKHIVSMRLNNADRISMRTTAARLFVRESELYRFAVYHLLHRLHRLHDETCSGSDLLPLFLEFREELNFHLGLKKN
ncbi:MAG: hypothetical protein ABSB19_08235, partial [Methylomonas sp.]